MNIIFMGTPHFAVPILKAINDSGHKILEVYTQPATKRQGSKIYPIRNFSLQKN